LRIKNQKLQAVFQEALGLLNTMVHPNWANDLLEAPRHRAFLAVALVTGALSLVLLPLHLALFGPTPLPLVLMISWMLAQWPLAHYLSQTGRLDRAYGLSALCFATFLGAMAYVTGGPASFAMIWLAVVPLEAALSGSRRMVLTASLACAVVVGVLYAFAPASSAASLSDPFLMTVSGIAALLYTGGLCARLVADMKRMKTRLATREDETRLLNQGTGNLVLRCCESGGTHFVGGNPERFLGTTKRQLRGNWLFQRIHVADRPAYLQELSEARAGSTSRRFEFRLRHGANEPGDEGTADYIWVSAEAQPTRARDNKGDAGLLLCLSNITERKEADQDHDLACTAIQEELHRKNGLVAAAGVQLRGPAENFVKLGNLLNAMPETRHEGAERTRAVVDELMRTGRQLMQTVDGLEETAALDAGLRSLDITAIDLQEALEIVGAEMQPLADSVGVALSMSMPHCRTTIPADRKVIHNLLIQSFRAMLDNAADGDHISLTASRGRGAVELTLQMSVLAENDNRNESQENAFRFTMVERLCAMQGGVTESHVEPNGECRLMLRLPYAAPVSGYSEPEKQDKTPPARRIA